MTTSPSEAIHGDLFDIASELEYTHVQLHQVRNMLSVYDERLEQDLNALSKDARSAAYFVARYDALRSLMEVMQQNLGSALEEIRVQVDRIYDVDRKARPRPLPAE